MNDKLSNVKIIDTAYGGYGVGKLKDGYTIFVPFAVEGDTVDVEIVEKKKSHSFAKIVELKEFSNKRRKESLCKHLYSCGGCLFGYIEYDEQIRIKKRIINNFFRKFDNFKIDEIVESHNFRYRLRAKFRVEDRKLGFYGFKSNHFVPIDDCQLVKRSIVEKGKAVATSCKSKSLYDCYIIENEAGEALINVSSDCDEPFDFAVGVKTAKTVYGKNKICIGNPPFYAGFNTFAQSNRFLMNIFQNKVLDFIEEGSKVLELYAGSGFFTTAISKKVDYILAVEENRESVEMVGLLNLKNVKTLCLPVEKLNSKKLSFFDTVLLNPPRSGVDKKVINLIKRLKPSKIVYVSCNPSTLVRDILRLSDYEIGKTIFLDQFPDTYHIEMIVELRRDD